VAAAGLPCALVTPDAVAGTQLSRTGDLADANGRLERAGVARELFARLRSVGGGTALLTDVDHGAAREIPCTVVIDCAHRLPDGDLWRARRGLLRDEQLPTRGAGSPDSRELTALTARRAGARGTTHGGSGRESRGPAARLVPAGDCVAPRTVHEAVREGRRAVQRLRRAAGIVGADRPDARPVP
jgi:2,4-dienoyl-CoA reductase (NADPH2)